MRFKALFLVIIGCTFIPVATATTTNTSYSSTPLGFAFDYPTSYTVTETSTASSFTVTLSAGYNPVITILRTSNEDLAIIDDQNTSTILIDQAIPAELSSIYTTDEVVFQIPDTAEYLFISGSGDAFTTVLETLSQVSSNTTQFHTDLGNDYGFSLPIPSTWEDYTVVEMTVDGTNALGSYTEWNFYLPTTTATNAYQLWTDSNYYGKVFSLQRYANPNHLSVVGWQNTIPTVLTTIPTAIATDGETIFAYVLDTDAKQYRDFANDLGEPITDATNLLASFRFTYTFSDFFTDVPAYHLYRRAIEELSVAGIISGYPDGTFDPDATVNRAELAKILVEGLGITPDGETYHHCFPDVTEQWYAPSVCYAQTQGWVQGYPDGKFHPEKTVNKVEALKMVVAAHGFSLASELTLTTATLFNDTPVTEWYAPYLKTALDRGLLEEPESDAYNPSDGRTRGSITEMIFRVRVAQSIGVDEYFDRYRDKVTTAID